MQDGYTIADKLKTLSEIAHVLNEKNIIWALGASMLLYLKGKTDYFNDIDIMVHENDVEPLKDALESIGVLSPKYPDKQFKTRYFFKFVINGIDVDVMGGLVIVKDGKEFDCSFYSDQIDEIIVLNDETIPLQSLKCWRKYYELMGREKKVKMLDGQ